MTDDTRNYGDERIVEFDALAAQYEPGSHGQGFWANKAKAFRLHHSNDKWRVAQEEIVVGESSGVSTLNTASVV